MQLVLTRNMKEACQAALHSPSLSHEYRDQVKAAAEATLQGDAIGVSVAMLQHVAQCMDNVWLHELMQGTSVYIEPKPKPVRDPAFEEYMKQLRLQQEERDYERMISSVSKPTDSYTLTRTAAQDLREIKSHLAAVVNILFSMVAVYCAIFFAASTMLEDPGLRVLLSLFGAAGIGIVESILYLNYAQTTPKPKQADVKTRRRVQKSDK